MTNFDVYLDIYIQIIYVFLSIIIMYFIDL